MQARNTNGSLPARYGEESHIRPRKKGYCANRVGRGDANPQREESEFPSLGSVKSLIAGSDGKQSPPGLMGTHQGPLLKQGGWEEGGLLAFCSRGQNSLGGLLAAQAGDGHWAMHISWGGK